MSYKQKREISAKIDYNAIKTQKNEMLQRFLLAKKKAGKSGQIVAKPI